MNIVVGIIKAVITVYNVRGLWTDDVIPEYQGERKVCDESKK